MSLSILFLSSEGRIPRSTFWLVSLGYFCLLFIPLWGSDEASLLTDLLALFGLLATYPVLVVAIKRFHDRNRSGWFLLGYFVPFVNIWLLIELFFLRGTVGDNTYGPDPLRKVHKPALAGAGETKAQRLSPARAGETKVTKPAPAKTGKRAGEPVPTPPGSAIDRQAYLGACLSKKYAETPETRSYDSDPAFRRVLGPLNENDYMTACHEAEALAPQFPDFAYVYCWWASALVGMSEFDEARAILAGAIDRSKQKYPLCELLGKIEWKSRRIDDAIYWWAQAMHCQESLCDQNYGGDIGAYLYLYYVADGLGLINEATALLMRVDQIQFGTVRLAPGPANDLRMLAQKASERPVPEVLHQLVATYIVPEKKIEKEVDPTEFAQLIRQLVGGSYDKRSAAAKRLGDLGDPQAIVPLRNAVQEDPVIGFKEEVEEAIKRIMEANR